MKLATFRVETPIGPFDRFGLVRLDGNDVIAAARDAAGWVVDANAAFAAFARDQGRPNPTACANALVPSDLKSSVELHGPSLEPLIELEAWLDQRWDAIADAELSGPRGEVIAHRLGKVALRAPIQVPVLRDFAAFEDHLQVTFGKMGLKIPPEWYEQPTAFKGNATALFGHDAPVRWPRYTKKLDYEIELAAVIGVPARDVGVDQAANHILGYTILNDYSARDTQRGEMAMSTGPFKGKDFAWALGPWIVTPDEFGEVASTKMRVRVNGEVWAESTPGAMQWSFPEMISYTSQDETLNVGDVFGSGTVNNGCGFEIDRWLSQGDVVEIEAAKIGVLRNSIAAAREQDVVWRQKRHHANK
jgi:2-keto-4-pentenoate hydratase/2-oxohepta-3-ene-1,7-dioic acid hydratase in catechol pathway